MNRYEALKHAVKAHAGQLDKCGRPYVLHPIAVAEALDEVRVIDPATGITHWIDDYMAVALLHDVLEDTDYLIPADQLNGAQSSALIALTRRTERQPFPEPYAEYIERVCGDFVACIVKLADLWHNLQPERQDCLPEKERRSLEARYLKARDRIWEALGYEWWPTEGPGDQDGRKDGGNR